MHCPRCGTENERRDRFCANCGASLRKPKGPSEELPLGQRISRALGATRRARLLSAGTALAVVIAIFAAIALPANDNGRDVPRDSYTVAADRVCVGAKKQIGATSSRALAAARNGGPAEYARNLVPIVAQWRVDFNSLHPPTDRVDLANDLDASLRDVETQAASLALAAEQRASGPD